MKAFATVFPVFLMMFLGHLARKRRWITSEQNDGVRKIVFDLLFPVMVFNVIFTSELKSNLLHRIVYIEIIWLILYFLGKVLVRQIIRHGGPYFEQDTSLARIAHIF